MTLRALPPTDSPDVAHILSMLRALGPLTPSDRAAVRTVTRSLELAGGPPSDLYQRPRVHDHHWSSPVVARALRVSRPTITALCEAGVFPNAVRLGGEQGEWRIPDSDLRRWYADQIPA